MSNSAISAVSASNTTASASSVASVGNNLTQADFLSLMTTQLENQDPLKPMDDSEFVAELAQFTSLQQTSDISSTLKTLTSSVQQSGAVSYLGKEVLVTDSKGNAVTGIVTSIGINPADNEPAVTVNGTQYDVSTISGVADTGSQAAAVSSIQQMNAVNYLGKQVSLTDSKGNAVSGVVSAIGTDTTTGQPAITVNGVQYDVSTITSVTDPVATTTPGAGTGS